VIEKCSPSPWIELFARVPRRGWTQWGLEAETYKPPDSIYTKHSERPGLFDAIA